MGCGDPVRFYIFTKARSLKLTVWTPVSLMVDQSVNFAALLLMLAITAC